MLTKLRNGDHVDLATATIIQVGEREVMSATGTVIPDRVIIKWQGPQDRYGKSFNQCVIVDYDTLEEAQAEADRLAEIANNQRSGVVMLNNSYFKANDVLETQVKAFPRSWACRVFLRENRSTDVWFDTPAGTSDEDLAAALGDCEQKARAYARELMAQVAGAK